jgi:hypothetical protein
MRLRKILLYVLISLIVVVLNFISFIVGSRNTTVAEPTVMIEKLNKGKATFCDLNEDARLFLCPVLRRGLPIPGGAALIYACDSEGAVGFVSFLGKITPEVKTQAIQKLLEAGLKTGPHCTSDREDILWIKKDHGKR